MSTNIAGDLLVSGNVLNPALGAVLVDTGALTTGYPNHGYYDIVITLQCTVTGTFSMGTYDGSNNPLAIFSFSTSAANSAIVTLHNCPIVDGQKFRVTVPAAILGTANVAVNIALSGGD